MARAEGVAEANAVDVVLRSDDGSIPDVPEDYDGAYRMVLDARDALTERVEAVLAGGGVAALTMPPRMGHEAKVGYLDAVLELFPELKCSHRDVGDAEQILIKDAGQTLAGGPGRGGR